ncbi:MAG: ribosomal-protein-alanine N-acetyltransferase [Tenericutes bacterium HGW-Tenericutes-5]|jgi:ribosomal-protein-alanine N-acetyltransferase|nr:MAG: ribosomal-protein-alanine N-acetyltransferase [Tenericutes bacterium HGW-Tenericutes-5]
MKIRKAILEDLEIILEYENKYFHNFTTLEKLYEDFYNPLIHIYLLVEEEVLGYMIIWIDEDKAQINSFVVIEELRRKGYGEYFLDNTLEILSEYGVVEVTLEVRPSNIAAVSLYVKSGFKQVSVRKAYYNNGEDAYLMYKRLGSE